MLLNHRLQFAVDGEFRRPAGAGAPHIGTPGGELLPALFGGRGFVVRHVIHFAAEGVERRHAVALRFG